MPRFGSRMRRTLIAASLPIASVSFLLGTSTTAHATNAGPGFPAHYDAPYVETWNSPSAMAAAENATGNKYFTLAFVISDGSCNATYNGNDPITDGNWINAINSLRASGGDVIASFGGASGEELGQACTSVSSLQAQYQRVIDTLNLTHVDFDIEGAPSPTPPPSTGATRRWPTSSSTTRARARPCRSTTRWPSTPPACRRTRSTC